MPPTQMPRTIGPYAVTKELGQGAFGVVYLARDPALDRDVAIKLLKPEALGSKKYVERFLREAKVVAQMLHGNIVPVYQLGDHEGGYFIASAFIPGTPLSAAIPEDGLEPGRSVQLVLQLLEALGYAHEHGVLHRDVKPANAMLDDKDRLYLMDFGLAGWVGQDEGRMTQDGAVMGTPAYMAPEQARGDIRNVGPAADQYSAGVVLYELLTGHLPFEGMRMEALLYNVQNTTPPPPSEWKAALDPELETLCLKALAKKPEERFGSCRAFSDALKTWGGGRATTTAVRPPTGTSSKPRKAPSTLRSSAGAGQRSTLKAPPTRPTVEPTLVPPPVPTPAPTPPTRRTWVFVGIGIAVLLVLILGIGTFITAGVLLSKAHQPAPSGGRLDGLR